MLFYANFVGFDKMFSSTPRKSVSLAYANITPFDYVDAASLRKSKQVCSSLSFRNFGFA